MILLAAALALAAPGAAPQGPDPVAASAASEDQAASAVTELRVPRELRLGVLGPVDRRPGDTSPDAVRARATPSGAYDVHAVAVRPGATLRQRAELHLGQALPPDGATPAAVADGPPFTFTAPDVMLRLTGAWVVVRWMDGDATVFAYGYRLAPRSP